MSVGEGGFEDEHAERGEPATLDDLLGRLKVLTYDVTQIRKYVAFLVFVIGIQALLYALWLFGVITIEFKPASRL